MEKLIRLSDIRLDGGTQPRTLIDEELVSEYSNCIDDLPPITVFHDGVDNWLADGFHRFFAHNRANLSEINCIVINGTQRDAILHSVGVNADHGKRRTNEDKRKAVLTLLKDDEWSKWSNRQIAKACKVSPGFVDTTRKDLPTIGTSSQERKYIDQKGRESVIDTSNLAKKRNSEPISIPEPEPIKQQLPSYLASDDDQELPEEAEMLQIDEDEIDWNLYEEITDKLSYSSMSTIREVLEWIENKL